MVYIRTYIIYLIATVLGNTVAMGQATIIDNGVPNNKWILHNPEDPRKTLFIAPFYNGNWDFNQQTQFRPNGDVNFSGHVGIGTIANSSATSRLEVYGDFRTTTGRFSSIYSQNTDGAYPANGINTLGDAQLSIGANWTSGKSDVSLINSNIANTTGGGLSFWQMTSPNSKNLLAYFAGNGQVGIGLQDPIAYMKLHVHGDGGIISTGSGAQIRIRDQQSTRTTEPWLDEWAWYSANNIARIHRPGLGDIMAFNGNGNVGIGTINPVSRLHITGGGLTVGTRVFQASPDGHLSIGDVLANDSPTSQNWGSTTSLILNALDYTSIGFHDSGNRVDFIRSGNGTIQLGYDGGWGPANVGLPNGVWNSSGNVGIGTTNPGVYKLAVEGKIGAREVEVKTGSWADFVFAPDYILPPLQEVERHIQEKHHLPGIPSEAEVKERGIELGQMNAKLLQKIEELTLYIIRQQKQIDELRARQGIK